MNVIHSRSGKGAAHARSRIVQGIAVAAAAAIVLTGCTSGGDTPPEGAPGGLSGEVIFADFGGPTHEAREAAFLNSFSQSSGARAVSTTIESALMYAMFEGKPGDYDMIQGAANYVYAFADNFEKLPAGFTGNDLLEEELRDYAAGGFVYAVAQGWLTETFPDGGPQNWVDFFDVEKFPGKRAWPGTAGAVDLSYEIALLADGVAPEDLYPLDIDRAEAKLDSMREHFVFYSSYAETQQLLASGTVSVAVTVSGQFTSLKASGLDVTVQWNEAFPSVGFFVIPKQAKNKENALALAEWMAVPENEVLFVESTGYGPANSETMAILTPEQLEEIPNTEEKLAIAVIRDERYRADNEDMLFTRYGDWLAR